MTITPVTSATPNTPKLQLLRDVSRSFYLSIRVLPAPLRQPVAVGYLLARATDTLADTAQLPAGQRRIHLQTLIDATPAGGTLRLAPGTYAGPASICLLYTSPSPRD